MSFLLGIDTGTSSSKAVIVDGAATGGEAILGAASEAYSYEEPRAGWAEQNPDTWWDAACGTIREAVQQAGIASRDVAAVGLSGQMHGTVMLDDGLRPLGNAIIWPDTRSSREVEEIQETLGTERLGRLTGNPIATGFMAATLCWIRKNDPRRWDRLRHVLLPKDYVLLRLTGQIGTDPCNASSTLLFDTAHTCWSKELLEHLHLSGSILPPVGNSCELAGSVTAEAAEATTLAEGTPVIFGGGDLAMAAVGSGIVKPGMACVNIGTGGQFFVVADKPVYDPKLRLHTFCHAIPHRWTVGGAVLCAGLALRWFCENVCGFDSYEQVSESIGSVEPGCGGLIFLPYLAGVRSPYMNPDARGMFFGLTTRHDKAALARAIAEGVAFSLRESLEIMKEMGLPAAAGADPVIASGGGAQSTAWKQIMADVFNRPVRTVDASEQAAVGAAICAGVGCGTFTSVEAACATLVEFADELTQPVPRQAALYDRLFELFQKLYADNEGSFGALKQAL